MIRPGWTALAVGISAAGAATGITAVSVGAFVVGVLVLVFAPGKAVAA